jgi:hypothetical protein
MISRIILAVVGLFLVASIVRSLISGDVRWYSGELLSANRSTNAVSFWIILTVEALVVLFIVWLLLPA